jgi:hypothetical protein
MRQTSSMAKLRLLKALALTVLLSFPSCGGGSSTADDLGQDSAGADAVVEISGALDLLVLADTTAVEVMEETYRFVDLYSPDTAAAGCEAGAGCFLDKCDSNEDCQFGWCVLHLGEAVCSQTCQEECPPGWSCQQVAGTVPDVVYICVSDFTNLCRPCKDGNDCKSEVGAEDVCVDYGAQGSFCGGTCASGDDCPWGFSCLTTNTVDGIETTQCVADAGVCPCTTQSVSLSLWTPCHRENEWGQCAGMRVCEEGGLTECDAPVPAQEVCNGLDDDCDDEADEPELVDGNYVNACDDGNPCTQDLCKGEEGCVNTVLDGGECADGDPCTVADHCEEGACVGKPVDCDDENPCTQDLCTEDGGCENIPASGECDDGDVCTLGDHCIEGSCAGEPVACDCVLDEDCDALEDGNLCNGMLVCDTDTIPYKCVVDDATILTCPSPEGPGAACLAAACDGITGQCSFSPANDGALCDDDDACTLASTCLDGECGNGQTINCNDGNLCTDDSCDPDVGCLNLSNSATCNDGDVCTVGDQCADGQCVGTGDLVCDDADLCNGAESCDPDTGCQAGLPLVCDDHDVCNGAESCDPLEGCQFGVALQCTDSNLCDGQESCHPQLGCVQGEPLECDDGDLCNGQETCDPLLGCVQGESLVCDDFNSCTADSCQPDAGCVFDAVDGQCDDGDLCTLDDFCLQGACVPGVPEECNDEDPCTDEYCNPSLGCVTTLNKDPCDDDDLCTTGDHCHLGDCISSGQLTCVDGNPCTDDSCQPLLGCQFGPNQEPCDDANKCTTQDQCSDGFCVGTVPPDCADEDLCTKDLCDPADGCIHPPALGAPCDDGNFCTLSDTCEEGGCVGHVEMSCDDENLCTDDACVDGVGCVNTPNTAQCEDGLFCTVGDQCGDSQCLPGPDLASCDDSNECTTDVCDEGQDECIYSPAVDFSACANGTKWCKNGDCVAKEAGIFCITGPEKATMSGAQICEQFFGLPCGPTATKTYHANNCSGSIHDSGRNCGEMPLDPYNMGSAALVCGQ